MSRPISASADSLSVIPQPFLKVARTTPQAGGKARLQNLKFNAKSNSQHPLADLASEKGKRPE